MAFSTNTTLAAWFWAKRSFAKSSLPITIRRPFGALAAAAVGGLTATARIRVERFVRAKSCCGDSIACPRITPAARLDTSSGVTVPLGACVVSMELVQGRNTPVTSAFTVEARVDPARIQRGYDTTTWPYCDGSDTASFAARSYTMSGWIDTPNGCSNAFHGTLRAIANGSCIEWRIPLAITSALP